MGNGNTKRVAGRLRRMRALRPRTAGELHRFVRVVLGVDVPRVAVEGGNVGPFEYVCHAFFEGVEEPDASSPPRSTPQRRRGEGARDCVVWANRGGGKTMLGAVATLLDLMFKPGVQVRILGGSLEQSSKMYEHLTTLADRPLVRGLLASQPTARRLELADGGAAAILAGSQRSVRGVRVHKLRVDEVEELDPAVWDAAQLVTRSSMCGDIWVRGTVEALSTMHRPMGPMSELVVSASRRVLRWNALDVAARCEAWRACDGCPLWKDCGGRLKEASGYLPVSDLIAQRERTSENVWEAEAMCRRPQTRDSVYPRFDIARHVCISESFDLRSQIVIGGMDFGVRSPLVMLWAMVEREGSDPRRWRVSIMGEYVEKDRTLDAHLDAADARAAESGLGRLSELAWLGVDPAGRAWNGHTGLSDTAVLRRRGCRVRAMASRIKEGIELVRRRLDHDMLTIHPRCTTLIAAMQSYCFDSHHPERDTPLKDGPDHACDAVRYLLVNLEAGGETRRGSYL